MTKKAAARSDGFFDKLINSKKTTKEDLVDRLTSRKFWLTVIVCGYFMWRGVAAAHGVINPDGTRGIDIGAVSAAFSSLTQVIVAFLAIQGGTDAIVKYAESRYTTDSTNQPEQPPFGD